MPYLKLSNGVPEVYSIGQLRQDNPNTSFPKQPSDSMLTDWGVYPYSVAPQPAYDELTHTLVPGPFVQEASGAWLRQWSVDKLPLEDAERNVRDHRGRLLSSSDWTQVADTPANVTAWATYRAELRTVPEQPGFPYDVLWPNEPE